MLSRFLHIDDSKTWDAFRKGNHDAFAHIYQVHFRQLYHYGRKFCQDDALVGDILQQLFTELWHKRRRIGPTDHIKNYLYKSFRRLLLRNLKQKKNKVPEQATSPFAISISHEAELIQQEFDLEQQKSLNQAIDRLTEKQKEVIYLKFYDGLSYAEISEIMHLDAAQVYNFMYKALRSLRRSVKKGGNNTPISTSALVLLILSKIYLSPL